jgi:hypothetical protein
MIHLFFTANHDWMSPMYIGNTTRSTPTEPHPMPRTTTRPAPPAPAAASSEAQAIIAAIAKSHLGLEVLDSRHLDNLDFQEHACYAIRDALRAAFEAGKQAGRRRAGSPPVTPPTVIDGDIVITADPKAQASGWTTGRIGSFRFCAKVFPEHALIASYEIGRSRISKLELRRLDTGAIAYHWDRGLDVAAQDAEAAKAVKRLENRLANHLFGPAAR